MPPLKTYRFQHRLLSSIIEISVYGDVEVACDKLFNMVKNYIDWTLIP